MVNIVSRGCAQDLNSLQHIAILGINLCNFENPAQSYQQFDTRFVQIVLLQELQRVLLGREQLESRPV